MSISQINPIIFVFIGLYALVVLALDAIAIIKLLKKGCRNLSVPIWAIIILFVQFFGPISFLIFGMKTNTTAVKEEYDD